MTPVEMFLLPIILLSLLSSISSSSIPPNIILMLADDLGFNDVPWHNTVQQRVWEM